MKTYIIVTAFNACSYCSNLNFKRKYFCGTFGHNSDVTLGQVVYK